MPRKPPLSAYLSGKGFFRHHTWKAVVILPLFERPSGRHQFDRTLCETKHLKVDRDL